MLNRFAVHFGAGMVSLFLVACPTEPARVCAPGASVACVGPGGCTGGQMCLADGSGFSACDCGGPVDAGPSDAPAATDTPTSIDAPSTVDGGPSDAPALPCDPVAQTGCGTGERCVWRQLTTSLGDFACVANGTVAVGGACTVGVPGEATGFDDCVAGLACPSGICRPICDPSGATGCSTTEHCSLYVGLFANADDPPTAGVCDPSCDPVTQLLGDGSSCGSGRGCYWLPTTTSNSFVCAGAGTVAVGATITGTIYANSCVPGARALGRGDGTFYCAPFCRPVETHSGAPGGAAGASPFSCPDRGAASPQNECVFAWSLAIGGPPDARLNTMGVCFDRTGLEYDDGMGLAPWPSCTTRANTDDTDADDVAEHREIGCAPAILP